MSTVDVVDEIVDSPEQPDEAVPSKRFSIASASNWFWFWAALLIATLPMLVPYFADMWAEQHYQFFPFVFLAVGALVYQRSDGEFYAPRGWVGWTMVGLGVLTTIASIINQEVWLGGVGFVFIAIAMVASMRGEEDKSLAILGLPLLMLIKLPLGLDQLLIQNLQDITTDMSSVMLDFFGVSHAIEGNMMRLAERELFVAEACSGIQSVFTLAFLASLIIAFMRRRLWLAPFYFVIAILLAIAGNTIRVTTVALAEAWFETDLATGWQHELLGYGTLALAAGLLVSFDRLIITMLHPVELTSDAMMDNPFAKFWNYLVSDRSQTTAREAYSSFGSDRSQNDVPETPAWLDRVASIAPVRYGFLGIVALLLVTSFVQLGRMQGTAPPQTMFSSRALYSPPESIFGSDFDLFEISGHRSSRDGQDPRLGENADLWDCEVGNSVGQLVLSQAYSGWHELCTCYKNLDWELLDRDVVDDIDLKVVPDAGNDESFVTARFTRDSGQQGYLMFSAISYDGTIPDAPGSFAAFGTRFMGRLDRNGIIDQTDIMMFQFWLPTNGKLEPKVLRKLQSDFVKARATIAKAVVDPDSQYVQPGDDSTAEETQASKAKGMDTQTNAARAPHAAAQLAIN